MRGYIKPERLEMLYLLFLYGTMVLFVSGVFTLGHAYRLAGIIMISLSAVCFSAAEWTRLRDIAQRKRALGLKDRRRTTYKLKPKYYERKTVTCFKRHTASAARGPVNRVPASRVPGDDLGLSDDVPGIPGSDSNNRSSVDSSGAILEETSKGQGRTQL